MNLNERLKKARKEAHLTQSEVATELDLTQGTISKYESGEKQPSIEILTKLIELYGISADWLLETGMKK